MVRVHRDYRRRVVLIQSKMGISNKEISMFRSKSFIPLLRFSTNSHNIILNTFSDVFFIEKCLQFNIENLTKQITISTSVYEIVKTNVKSRRQAKNLLKIQTEHIKSMRELRMSGLLGTSRDEIFRKADLHYQKSRRNFHADRSVTEGLQKPPLGR